MPGAGVRPEPMKTLKNLWQKIKNNRKFRCGGFSVLLSACAVLLFLLLSALSDSLESRYALTADLSFNAATTISDTTEAVLDQLHKPVHVYAVIPEDGANETLLSLLERYAARTGKLTYSRESIVKNPMLLTRFQDAISEKEITSDCLIVSCPENGRARVLTEDDYYVYSYNSSTGFFDEAGYTYEKSLTEAVLYVSQDDLPTLQILEGHGEMTQSDAMYLEETLLSANYLLKRVNLNAGDALDAESPLLLLSPQHDLTDAETEMLTAFGAEGGDLFIVTQYSDPMDLKNFNALLRAYGVESLPGLVIAEEEDRASYYADTPVWLLPYMRECSATEALLESGKDILLLAGSRAFALPESRDTDLSLYAVLETGKAYIRNDLDGAGLSTRQESDLSGYFPVAVWTDKVYANGNISHAFICGNATVFTDYWTIHNTDSTAFLLQMLRSLQGKSPVSLDILPINALRDGLRLTDLTPAVIVTAAVPLLIVLMALLILLPRKNL